MRCYNFNSLPRIAFLLIVTCSFILQSNSSFARNAKLKSVSSPQQFQAFSAGKTRAQSATQALSEYNQWLNKPEIATNGSARQAASIRVDQATAGPGILFFDDMESGINGWTISIANDTIAGTPAETLWHQSQHDAASGVTSWWSGDENSHTYNTGATIDQSLTSPPIAIPPDAGYITLLFSEMFMTEAKWDNCLVEYTTDAGTSWLPLNAPGSSGFSYDWKISQYELGSFPGATIQVRFHFYTKDALFNDYLGWMVDNVMVYEGTGFIAGSVYYDRNQNHLHDGIEPPLDHWNVTIEGDGLSISTRTDFRGYFEYNLPYGDYTVTTEVPTNWIAVAPPAATRLITIAPASPICDTADFGLWRQMSFLSGYVFNDINHNGIKDGADTLVPGQYVILGPTGSSSDNWRWHLTDETGYFSFGVYHTGTYSVLQQTGTFKIQTFPAGNQPYTVPVPNLVSTFADLNFGDYFSGDPSTPTTSHIGGFVYLDENRNGIRDEHESGIPGIMVTATGPELRTLVTDSLGHYLFEQLTSGGYNVSVTPVPGLWPMLAPPYRITVQVLPDSGVDSVGFGLKSIHRSSASGVVFSDLNRNGQLDSGEPGLPGWTISASGFDAYGSPVTSQSTTGPDGLYTFDSLWQGSYHLNETFQGNWVQTLPSGFLGYNTTLDVESMHTGLNFGNHYDSTFNTSYRSFIQESVAYSLDTKGKNWGPTKGLIVGADFTALFVNNTGLPAQQLFIMSKYPMTDSLTCSVPAIQTIDGTKKSFSFTFTSDIPAGDTVVISGHTYYPGKALISFKPSPFWRVSLHDREIRPAITALSKRYLPPNAADMLVAMHTLVKVGAGTSHDVVMKKYTDVGKSLYDPKTKAIHNGSPRCIDVYDATGMSIKKQLGALRPKDQNNKLFAEMTALRISILASDAAVTPRGFGDLIFDDGGTNPFNGKSVRFIAAKVDTFLSSYTDGHPATPCHMPAGCDTVTPGELWNTIRLIDAGFSGPIEYLSYTPKPPAMFLTGTRSIEDVPYMHIDTSLWISGNMNSTASTPESREPIVFSLRQNYPNPFNPSTRISFTLPDEAQVTMQVYNLLGQEVAVVLDNEAMTSGNQEVTFDASKLASGVYFYRINARVVDANGNLGQSYTDLKKMVLVK